AVIESFGGTAINFVTNGDWMQFWVIFVTIWAQMGFYTLILLAGLQSIPPELYEAGQIDGANKIQSFRSITLPLLMPTLFVVLVLALIRAVQVFDQVFVLTGGGPGTVTTYMVQYIYETAFTGQPRLFGLAAAASVSLGLVLFVLTMVQLYLGRDSEAA
ncbi:MAG: sugar ABC transporter permease, partial [Chloroflexota bacterium]